MSKQLRIWLFVLLGTLLTSTSLLAEGVITMTTSKAVGKEIILGIEANGNVTIEGVKEVPRAGGSWVDYILTSQTITIRGDVTSLDCYRSQLTSLDVSGCSALTTLWCYENQLTSLDVSQNTALTTLSCSFNQLTSLNVSGCTALTDLLCYENQLTSLDVSDCSALTWLECCYNQLTSLNVSGCTALTTLWCYENQLTSLDVSQNTALTWLTCYKNQLTSLDVSQNTALTELYCYGNQLTSLGLSACPQLNFVDCSANQINGKAMTQLVASLPTYNSGNEGESGYFIIVSNLAPEGNVCSKADVATARAKNWNSFKKVNEGKLLPYEGEDDNLQVGNGVITMTTTKAVGETIELRIEANGNVTIEGAQETGQAESLGRKSYTIKSSAITIRGDMTTLWCYENQLTSLDVSGCSTLTMLDCSWNQLTSLDVSQNTALTSLDCWSNELTSLDVSQNTALTSLGCGNNELTSLDVSQNTALTTLFCPYNQLTSLDVSQNTTLTSLSCWKNQLTSLNVSGCTALTMLFCSDNQLTSLNVSGCSALTMLWCSENQLTSLDVSNHIALTTLQCSKNLLRKIDLSGCTSIRFLTCHVNQIKAPEMANLVNSLPDLQGKGVGLFKVFYEGSGEGNVCFAAHVATAKAKSWKTLFTRDYTWHDYTGADNPVFTVTFSSTSGGEISFTGADNLNAVPYGTTLTVIATPAEGYELTGLTANDRNILDTKKVVVNEDLIIKATFTKKTFAVTLTSNEHGTISIAEPVDLKAVPYGTKLTVKATGKNAQCVLTALTANGEDILATQSFVVKGATEVKATFVDHTGVETTVTQQTQLYPNPATDYVIVEGVAPASEVTLHSMTGERLYAGRADSRGTLRIDLTPYADGVYLVCVADETYRVVVRR